MSDEWTVPFEWGPAPVERRRLVCATLVLLGAGLLYQVGVVHAARLHVLVEIGIALGFPVALALGRFFRETNPRILQLLWFESGYNVLVILNKLALGAELPGAATVVGYGFGLFFVVQVYGFVSFELGERRYVGVAQSLVLGGLIAAWFFTAADHGGRIDAAGRFLMWGEDAPLAVQIGYAVWVINALACDLNDLHLRLLVLHLASVTVALTSGEFFHARLLTASHLFCLDLAFQYNRMPPRQVPEDVGFLPVPWRRRFVERIRDPLAWTTLAGVVAVAVAAAALGLGLGG